MQTQAQKLFSRLTRVEKLIILGASDGRLSHLSDNSYRTELVYNGISTFDERHSVLREVQNLVDTEFKSNTIMVGL